jgi:hypothetical protein
MCVVLFVLVQWNSYRRAYSNRQASWRYNKATILLEIFRASTKRRQTQLMTYLERHSFVHTLIPTTTIDIDSTAAYSNKGDSSSSAHVRTTTTNSNSTSSNSSITTDMAELKSLLVSEQQQHRQQLLNVETLLQKVRLHINNTLWYLTVSCKVLTHERSYAHHANTSLTIHYTVIHQVLKLHEAGDKEHAVTHNSAHS